MDVALETEHWAEQAALASEVLSDRFSISDATYTLSTLYIDNLMIVKSVSKVLGKMYDSRTPYIA